MLGSELTPDRLFFGKKLRFGRKSGKQVYASTFI
jgi:hypothetical protein